MSIFSHLRRSRQQAKEHNAKVAEQKKKESEQVPYKHVPTHAATDAFASAPPSWREADRSRIVEQNRRRSAMAASGHHMNMPGVPRVGSSLSRVAYPGDEVTPMVRMPRAYSYSGLSPYPGSTRDGREVVYASPDMAYLHPASLKGKEVPRSYDSQRISPASSKGDPSPGESSSDSTSSQDDLEMKHSKSTTSRSRESNATHRLHPSRARRTSDASVNQYTLSTTPRGNNSNYPRDSRPPPSMRGFASIPAIAAMPPMNIGVLPGTIAAHGHIGQVGNHSASPSTSLTPTSRQSSSTSLPGLSNMPAKQAVSAPVTPAASTAYKSEYPLNWLSIPGPESDSTVPTVGNSNPDPSVGAGDVMAYHEPPQASYSNRQGRPSSRSQQVEQLEQHTWEAQTSIPDHQRMDRSRIPPPVAHEDLVNVFPEQAGPEAEPKKSGKGKKLSKSGGGKLLKKNRWSSSKAPAVAV